MFCQLFDWGGQYLQPSSRILGLSLVSLATWAFVLGNPVWKYNVVSLLVLAPVAVWEILYIFPINERVKALDAKLESSTDGRLDAKQEKELERLLWQWSKLHVARFVLPLAAGVISALALTSMS